jgi:hypothetical protein
LPGHDGVEDSSCRIPVLERGDIHREPAQSRQLGHARIDLHAEQPTTRCLELSSGDTGTDADVENVEAGLTAMICVTNAAG